MAKKLPKPFQRPGITIEIPGARKEWLDIVADDVQVGDIVQGRNRGLVVDVAADGQFITLSFKNGGAERLFLDTPVTAFVEESRGNRQ